MNNKVLAAIVAVVVIIVVVAAAALALGNDDNNDQSSNAVIIYNGNGGTSNGQETIESSSSTVSSMGFTYDGAIFISWNTNADGTGTSYSNGSTVSASAGDPITLYAQWGYTVNLSFSSNASSTLTAMLVTPTSGTAITGALDIIVVPVSGSALVYVQSSVDLEWIHEEGSNRFTAQNGNMEYIVTLNSTSGTENVDWFINTHDYPVMSFDIVGQPSISISIIQHQISN